MLYDHNVGNDAVYAPARADIVIRSQASQKPPKVATPAKTFQTSTSIGNRIDVNKLTSYLSGITRQTTTRKCARSVRLALQAAGAQVQGHPVAAADWGSTLLKIGYKKINLSFDHPQKGDIYIINRTAKNQYGHIAAYSGKAWVSDFKQRSHDVYRNQNVTYSYYRLAD